MGRTLLTTKETRLGGLVLPAGVRVRVPSVRADYEFASGLRNVAGGRNRHVPHIETTPEEGLLTQWKRLTGTALARDLLRNDPLSHGIAKALRSYIIGDGGHLRFNAQGKWYDAAQRWFNSTWSRHANFQDLSTWRECLQLAVVELAFCGDFVALFDNGCLSGGYGTGRIVLFETDRITPLTEADFKAFEKHHRGWKQAGGILLDDLGRKAGVVVSKSRGENETAAKDAFILTLDPMDPDSAPWVHVSRSFRLSQLRGVPDSYSTLQNAIDSHEMLLLELLTAKVGASRYASIIEGPEAPVAIPEGFEDEVEDEGGDGGDSGGETGGETGDGDEDEDDDLRAEGLERFTGGNMDYLPPGYSIQFDPATRPNSALEPFLNFTNDLAGVAHGLTHTIARGRADGSYSAFKGDLSLFNLTVKDLTQFIESAFSDRIAEKAIRWGMERGEVPKDAPDGWADLIAWTYAERACADEEKDQRALAQKFKNGLTTLRQELGPSWREPLTQLADEVAFARSLGLPLGMLETASGATTTAPESGGQDGKEKDE